MLVAKPLSIFNRSTFVIKLVLGKVEAIILPELSSPSAQRCLIYLKKEEWTMSKLAYTKSQNAKGFFTVAG